jgi:hypothetical protein
MSRLRSRQTGKEIEMPKGSSILWMGLPALLILFGAFIGHGSRTRLFILATLVTTAGLIVVVWAAHWISKLVPRRIKHLAILMLFTYGAALVLRPSAWPLMDLAVLIGAVGGAVLLGRSLSSWGTVIAFLVTAAVVDMFSMSGGLSRVIMTQYQSGSSDLLLALALVAPLAGRLVPIVGISDLLVGGSAAIALIRVGYRRVVAIGTIASGFTAALIFGLWWGGAPGLPFIAVGVFLLVWTRPINPVRIAGGASNM